MSRSSAMKLFQRIPRRVAIQTHITPLTARPVALNPLYRSYHYYAPLPLTSAALRFQQSHQNQYGVSQTQTPRKLSPSPSSVSIASSIRSFTSTGNVAKGLSPESEVPNPSIAEEHPSLGVRGPAEISEERYHELSDEYMNNLVEKLEQLQEETEEVDCEYSSGVLTLAFPPAGIYVINKQPPNKQIWLSSPISGPKRYDYVMLSEGQDSKEGTGSGEWVYLRDGTTLSDLLEKEIGVDMSNPYSPVVHRGD